MKRLLIVLSVILLIVMLVLLIRHLHIQRVLYADPPPAIHMTESAIDILESSLSLTREEATLFIENFNRFYCDPNKKQATNLQSAEYINNQIKDYLYITLDGSRLHVWKNEDFSINIVTRGGRSWHEFSEYYPGF